MPTLEDLLTAKKSAVTVLKEKQRSLQSADDDTAAIRQAVDTQWNAAVGGVALAEAHADPDFLDTLLPVLEDRVSRKRDRKLYEEWKTAGTPPAADAEPDTAAASEDDGNVRRKRKAERLLELDTLSADELLERLAQAETARREREEEVAAARAKVAETGSAIRSRDRHWRVVVGVSVLHHAGKDEAFRTRLDQIIDRRITDSARPLLERWRNQDASPGAPPTAETVLPGWVPRMLANKDPNKKEWGAALLNPAGRSLPADLVGHAIKVAPRKGEPWVTRITEVIEATGDRIFVRHEGRPGFPAPARNTPATPPPDDTGHSDGSPPSGTEA